MKNIMYTVAMIALICGVGSFSVKSVQAGEVISLVSGEQVDITGDGAADIIKVLPNATDDYEDNSFNQFTVFINGHAVYVGEPGHSDTVNKKYLKVSQNAEYLNIYTTKGKKVTMSIILKYDAVADKLVKIKNILGKMKVSKCEVSKITSSYLLVDVRENFQNTKSITYQKKYTIGGDKLTLSGNSYNVIKTNKVKDKCKIKTKKPFKLTTKVTGKKVRVIVKKGKKVKLLKVTYSKKAWYGQFKYGSKKGYFKISK